ncbi:hypothetical protein CXF67_03400 [Psychroflexus sp. MES1-P1E]|nr:hypothetical protein CXF67_03400 [Psychroflexus sp. MES1-P1E]
MITQKEYQWYLSFLESYATKETNTFLVLYVLDGRYSFHSILGTQDVLALSKSLEEVIIVAIGSRLILKICPFFTMFHK